MTRVKIGVQLPEIERRVEWPELVTMARTAEDAGLDSIWLGDHLLYDLPDGVTRGPWEAWTSLAALAAVTTRVELGPLVASTSFHAPAMLAKMAATVDAVSGGRLVLGLGAGWNEREYAAFGFPYDHRVGRFEEAFTIIRTLLREGRADVHGSYYDVTDCVLDPGPVRPGGPPLMLGSTGPRMLRIALPHVDLWNTWWSDYANSPPSSRSSRPRSTRRRSRPAAPQETSAPPPPSTSSSRAEVAGSWVTRGMRIGRPHPRLAGCHRRAPPRHGRSRRRAPAARPRPHHHGDHRTGRPSRLPAPLCLRQRDKVPTRLSMPGARGIRKGAGA